MFQNVAFEVFIGLLFIFLLYSLLATIVQELIARFLDLRARMLVKAIRVLLDDRKKGRSGLLYRFWEHVVANVRHFFCPLPESSVSKVFYTHPAIKYLSRSSWKNKPSYIAADTFSAVVIQLLRGNYKGQEPQMTLIQRTLEETPAVFAGTGGSKTSASIDPETLEYLKQLFYDAQNDLEKFKASLEKWFNETMSSVSEWYKRQAQTLLFIIGLAIAIIFNVDAIAICRILSKDKTAREQIVQLASKSVPVYDTLTTGIQKVKAGDTAALNIDKAYDIVVKDASQSSGIMGLGGIFRGTPAGNKPLQFHPLQEGRGGTILGWLITTLAISLGAPFWFNLLSKVIKLRASDSKEQPASMPGVLPAERVG
ncbi:hypothetical protein [Filimonas effusa]|uniref:Uncharacterized protein n=1 Tax=Filimonas effusa TaxID=2508721 RepID=A0A4Q1D5C3_9BACT|nr:hypothetical protein [Filimonas effusa]RXK83732.1 hypothetical protein ESB13_16780 [Filimonas effusa]